MPKTLPVRHVALKSAAATPLTLPDRLEQARQLIGWFRKNARDLPWRRTRDPYAIWVSEIMLQQTQVATVIPYWERWLAEFPNPAALAAAPESRVLKLWEGLGYYSRARNLQSAAQIVVREHGGALPATRAGLLALPGIGPYTAGAIASIAFDQPAALLDGNVIRVLTRREAWAGDPKGKELNARLWAEAGHWVAAAASLPEPRGGKAPRNCSALNQALMELGATVCSPSQPNCGACPWRDSCRARAGNRVADFPETAARPAVEARRFATALVQHRGRWLMRQRPEAGVNAGYWEFPNLEIASGGDPLSVLAGWLGIPPGEFRPAGQLRHAITRYRLTQHLFRADVPRAVALEKSRWVSGAELTELPLTGPHRRLARTLVD